jgi:hypothetical protein
MKTMKTITLLLALCLSFYSYCQEKNSKPTFIEFVVGGETTPQLLKEINLDFQGNPDFQVTRMDIPTERFFGVYQVGKDFNHQWFSDKFQAYGLTIHCINSGLVGEKTYQHLSRKDCPELNNQ